MKTKEEIIKEFERTIWIASKFYLNGLLFCLDRNDLQIHHNSEKKLKDILKELKKRK